jgi:hypothetical protein
MRLMSYVMVSAVALSACSKSPPALVAAAAETAGQQLMQPLVQKDASSQAERMTELLSDKPQCEVFKERMREAGKGSPYEGTTQWALVHAQQNACAAGCCK